MRSKRRSSELADLTFRRERDLTLSAAVWYSDLHRLEGRSHIRSVILNTFRQSQEVRMKRRTLLASCSVVAFCLILFGKALSSASDGKSQRLASDPPAAKRVVVQA